MAELTSASSSTISKSIKLGHISISIALQWIEKGSTEFEDSLATCSSNQTNRNWVILRDQADSTVILRLSDRDGNVYTPTQGRHLRLVDEGTEE